MTYQDGVCSVVSRLFQARPRATYSRVLYPITRDGMSAPGQNRRHFAEHAKAYAFHE